MPATKLLYMELLAYRSDLLQLRLALVRHRNMRVYITSEDVMWKDNFSTALIHKIGNGISRYVANNPT